MKRKKQNSILLARYKKRVQELIGILDDIDGVEIPCTNELDCQCDEDFGHVISLSELGVKKCKNCGEVTSGLRELDYPCRWCKKIHAIDYCALCISDKYTCKPYAGPLRCVQACRLLRRILYPIFGKDLTSLIVEKLRKTSNDMEWKYY